MQKRKPKRCTNRLKTNSESKRGDTCVDPRRRSDAASNALQPAGDRSSLYAGQIKKNVAEAVHLELRMELAAPQV